MPIEWSQEFELGVPPLDHQHKALFEACNELLAALERGEGAAAVAPFFVGKMLLRREVEHHAAEEAVMAQHRYPEARKHAAAHAALRAHIVELTAAHAGRGLSSALLIAFCLHLRASIDHVIEIDYRLATFLRQSRSPVR
jgi:hemerythrin